MTTKEYGVMTKKQKLFYIEESNLSIIKSLQEDLGLSSESQVINYLLKQAVEQPAMEQRIAVAVRKELEENYLSRNVFDGECRPQNKIQWLSWMY